MADITVAELQTAIAQFGRVMVRTDEGEASGVILHPGHVAGLLFGAITGREERGPCRECSHREREHREIGSKDGGCEACHCRHYRAPLSAEPEPAAVHACEYGDAELSAMAVIAAALEPMDRDARRRVIAYFAWREDCTLYPDDDEESDRG